MTRAKDHGLELDLNKYHAALRARGLADVIHVPTPTGTTRRAGKIAIVHQRGITVDYIGCLAGGRFVAIEAKHRPDRIVISDLEPHQRDALARIDGLGGVAMVYGRMDDGSDLIIPWGDLIPRVAILGGDPLWTRPLSKGWYAAALHWQTYEQGGWPAVLAMETTP